MEKDTIEIIGIAKKLIEEARDKDALFALKTKYFGKNGEITEKLKKLGTLAPELRASVGKSINDAKKSIEGLISEKLMAVEEEKLLKAQEEGALDITQPFEKIWVGRLHPITRINRQIQRIFTSMGFSVMDGPHIEDDYHNFEALNIPKNHPARDAQDTFWLKNGALLRTHTSCVQVRTLAKYKPPLRVIAPGRVFRYEATDASHDNTFYQVEGLMVDKDISVGNMLYFMKTLLSEIFEKDVKIRLRPGFFPFVEPGFELDINCIICGGKGCSVCKRVGWVELLPCGLVHPKVLEMGGIDTALWNGWAFGLGLDRLVMMKYGIDDIRYFHSGDIRFTERV